MRSAKISDIWRGLLVHKYSTKLESLNIEGLNSFNTQEIYFDGGITAFCGLNGLGKSTLLNSINTLFSNDSAEGFKEELYKKVTFEKIEGTIKFRGNRIQKTVHREGDNYIHTNTIPEIKVSWVDTSYQVPNLIKVFSQVSSIPYLLDGSEANSIVDKELERVNYILGKEYTSCEVYEVELDEKLIPYFKVEYNGLWYGVEDMGHGELATLYMYWKFRSADRQTIFLLEEPETFLSHPSQKRIMNVLAEFSIKNNSPLILTTHSSAILTEVPVEYIKVFVYDKPNRSVKLVEIRDRKEYMFSLGLIPQKQGLLLVEDRVARILLKYWLSKRFSIVLSDYDVVDCSSKSVVESILISFPLNVTWIKVYGVLDGDQKGKMSAKARGKYAFLPGHLSFEEQCQELMSKYTNKASQKFGVNLSHLETVLTGIEGEDPHDWLINLSKHLGKEIEVCVAIFFDLGLEEDSEFRANEHEAFLELNKLLI